MNHLVLLGDSIFDNKSYVGAESGKDVITHVRESLPNNWKASLLAIDGSLIEDVSPQLQKVLDDASHFVISVGGNNALMNADILQMRANRSAQTLVMIAERRDAFEVSYQEMLREVLAKSLPTIVCTIYFPNFADAQIQRIATIALTVFNDVIIRQASRAGVPILDLRLICNEKSDYANEIEPSNAGGKKIAAKILEAVSVHDFARRRTEIFV